MCKAFIAALLWLLSIFILVLLMTGCAGLPTVKPTLTPVFSPTASSSPTPESTGTPTLKSTGDVTVTGNVWLRDNSGKKMGFLLSGTVVTAVCDGDWCVWVDGLKFYRGCSDDNPDRLVCRMED